MRIWHKDLIEVLPRQQLLGQWRECCLIAKNIAEKGTPNHILVDRVVDYPIRHFIAYTSLVYHQMLAKGYKANDKRFLQYFPEYKSLYIGVSDMLESWHNTRYFRQCLYNLQEKYDCGGISQEEWNKIIEKFGDQFDL